MIGEILACRLGAPGSWHDSRVAQPIYKKLRLSTPEGYYLVADTAFPQGSNAIAGRIRAPLKENAHLPVDATERAEVLAFNRQLLSLRQAAEWGNRALQGCFGRLRIPLDINNSARRSAILECCVRLYNLRCRRVGLNQIRSVYMPIWNADGTDTVWNGFEGMLFSDLRENDRVARFHRIAL